MPEHPLDRVRQLREGLGITQVELAARAGLSRQGLGAIEAGKVDPSLSVVVALARALGVTIDELVNTPDDAPIVAAGGGAVGVGDCVVVTRGAAGWVAHALAPGDEQPADGIAAPGPRAGKRVTVDVWAAPEVNHVVLAGCAPILSVVAQRLNLKRHGARYTWLHRTSAAALAGLERGELLVAGVHGDRPRRDKHVRVPMLTWESGLLVAPGNPLGIRALADLARESITTSVREPGAETRGLLERLLRAAGVTPEDVLARAVVARTHADVARAVAMNAAQVGFGPRAAGLSLGLTFVPLAEERFDLVVARGSHEDPRIGGLLDLVRSPSFRREASARGYGVPSAADR